MDAPHAGVRMFVHVYVCICVCSCASVYVLCAHHLPARLRDFLRKKTA